MCCDAIKFIIIPGSGSEPMIGISKWRFRFLVAGGGHYTHVIIPDSWVNPPTPYASTTTSAQEYLGSFFSNIRGHVIPGTLSDNPRLDMISKEAEPRWLRKVIPESGGIHIFPCVMMILPTSWPLLQQYIQPTRNNTNTLFFLISVLPIFVC